jgi:hypothetical protein
MGFGISQLKRACNLGRVEAGQGCHWSREALRQDHAAYLSAHREVENRKQHLEALRSARIGRQDRRGKADALRAFTDPVAHPRATHRDRTDAGQDLALGQMAVPHQPPPAILGQLVSELVQEACNLHLDGLRPQRSRAVAQNLGQRIGKKSLAGRAGKRYCRSWRSRRRRMMATSVQNAC